jgi:hypothetical protein
MTLRFRRRVKLLPGIHVNISRSGISTSIGVRGASLTLGKRGTYMNTGLPGTGISWRSRVGDRVPVSAEVSPSSQSMQGNPKTHHLHWWTIVLFLVAIIGACATKSNLVIGIFWCGWLGYWLFLAVRLMVRRMNRTEI